MSNNYYKILGVDKNATFADIKKAYRTLSLKYHPDRNSSTEATQKFQDINEAYETLSDEELRKKYDNIDNLPPGMDFNDLSQFNDLNNIFNMMFNGHGIPGMPGMPGMPEMHPNIHIFHNGQPAGNRRHYMNQVEIIKKEIDISLEQCYNGCVYPLIIERKIVTNNVTIKENETLYVNVPSGISSGETIIINDKGNILNSQKGALHITVNVQNNNMFIRDKDDLIYKKEISLKDALCGFTINFKHLNGDTFAINNSVNTSIIYPNYTKTIPNMGMKRGNNIGNLIIIFDVKFPNSLTPKQIEELKKIM